MNIACLSKDDREGQERKRQNECAFFFFNFFEFISVNSLKMANIGELPYGVLGTVPKFGSAKKLNLSQCLGPPNNVAKGNFLRLCSYRKARWTCKICCFFFYLLGSLPSPSPWPSSSLPGFIDLCKPLGIGTRF